MLQNPISPPKNRGRKGGKKGAPRSPFPGSGKPRVSPEVAAADAKRRADSLKKVNFDVDLELFGDAGTMIGGKGRWRGGGGILIIMRRRGVETIDTISCVPTMPGRRTLSFHDQAGVACAKREEGE